MLQKKSGKSIQGRKPFDRLEFRKGKIFIRNHVGSDDNTLYLHAVVRTYTLILRCSYTDPSVQSVLLVGSWDNFTNAYRMERDTRRDRGLWRGCHTFQHIICDSERERTSARPGGLKMGHTYYYYYELDGTTETHDTRLPSTNACPYLPGQTVNTMLVPVQKSSRTRSTSANGARIEDYRTMNPDSKFVSPRPAPSPPDAPAFRNGTAPPAPSLANHNKRLARSVSPASGWAFAPRKLFGRSSSSSLRETLRKQRLPASQQGDWAENALQGSRSRDISPDSLGRFLIDNNSTMTQAPECSRSHLTVIIPEGLEENDQDDNIVVSATVKTAPITVLSPPPCSRRSTSPSRAPTTVNLAVFHDKQTKPTAFPSPSVPRHEQVSHFSFDSTVYSPSEHASVDVDSPPSFYDSDDDDTETTSVRDDELLAFSSDSSDASSSGENTISTSRDIIAARQNIGPSLSTYSLPRSSGLEKGATDVSALPSGDSPSFLLSRDAPHAGLDDLVSELGWMADVIYSKRS